MIKARLSLGLLSLCVGSAMAWLPSRAVAQLEPEHPPPAASPQHFALDIKLGPYRPALDDNARLGGRTPFSDLFGERDDLAGAAPSRGLLTQGEIDYQFFHGFGTLAVGLSAGYYWRSAPALRQGSTGTQPLCRQAASAGEDRRWETTEPTPSMITAKDYRVSYESCISGDEVKLNVVPVSLLVVYRMDELSKRFRVPIIPYLRIGVGATFWWMGSSSSYVLSRSNGSGEESTQTSGASYGLVVHPGLAIDLSAIDSQAARSLDSEVGINRVSLFFEMQGSYIGLWSKSNKLNLSDTTFSGGLSFEF